MKRKSRKIRKSRRRMRGGSSFSMKEIPGEIYVKMYSDDPTTTSHPPFALIYLNNIKVDLENHNFLANVRDVWLSPEYTREMPDGRKFIQLKKFKELEKPLNDYMGSQRRIFNYRKFLEESIAHNIEFAAGAEPPPPPWVAVDSGGLHYQNLEFFGQRKEVTQIEDSSEEEFTNHLKNYLQNEKSIFENRTFSQWPAAKFVYFLHAPGARALSASTHPATDFVKLHISVKYEYLWDALELLNQYEELDNHFPIFKFAWGDFRHVEYKNKLGILETLEDDRFREYIKTLRNLGLSALAANIVLYPKKVNGEDGKESLIDLKTVAIDPFIAWWNGQEEQKRWKRDHNYLYFNIRVGETLFMAYGHSTAVRMYCHWDRGSCDNFIRENPLKVIENLRNKFCSRSDEGADYSRESVVNDTDRECLLHYFNLTEEQLCDDKINSLSSIYGLRDDIGNPPMETDLNFGDNLCVEGSDEMKLEFALKNLALAKIKQLNPVIFKKINALMKLQHLPLLIPPAPPVSDWAPLAAPSPQDPKFDMFDFMESPTEEELREELAGLTVDELKVRAEEAGASGDAIADLDRAPDIKVAAINLVVQHSETV